MHRTRAILNITARWTYNRLRGIPRNRFDGSGEGKFLPATLLFDGGPPEFHRHARVVRSDRHGEFIEGSRQPYLWCRLDAKFVVPSS